MPYVGRPSVGPLPIEEHLPAIETAVAAGPLVLTAAPGAGKSSLVPFAVDAALRSSAEHAGRVVMLQPRRLAARATATCEHSTLTGCAPHVSQSLSTEMS